MTKNVWLDGDRRSYDPSDLLALGGLSSRVTAAVRHGGTTVDEVAWIRGNVSMRRVNQEVSGIE